MACRIWYLLEAQFLPPFYNQDSDDEGNDNDENEKISIKREFPVRSPSPPAEDSDPEMSEELKEELLVGSVIVSPAVGLTVSP